MEADRTLDGKVSLSFFTTPNYFVGDVSVKGVPNRPTAGQVVNASKFQLGDLFTPDQVERALTNIKRLMQENGYYRSSVSEQEHKDPGRQQIDISFQVNPGSQARIGQVTVTGKAGYSQGQVQDIAKMHPGDLVSVQRVSNCARSIAQEISEAEPVAGSGFNFQEVLSSRSQRGGLHLRHRPRVLRCEVITEGFKIRRGVLKQNVPIYEENARGR